MCIDHVSVLMKLFIKALWKIDLYEKLFWVCVYFFFVSVGPHLRHGSGGKERLCCGPHTQGSEGETKSSEERVGTGGNQAGRHHGNQERGRKGDLS